MSSKKFDEQVASFVEDVFETQNGHHIHGVLISDALGRRLGMVEPNRTVTINTPSGPVTVTVSTSTYTEMAKAFSVESKKLEEVTRELEVKQQALVDTRQQLADANRDKESYRIRLEHLQRSIEGVADSMNYSLPGGRRR